MKKTILLCILLTSISCSSEKEKRKWRNHVKEETINGIENPYMVDRYFYIYYAAYNRANPDVYPPDLCDYRIYTLNKEVNNVENVEDYLNSLINKKMVNGINIDKQRTTSSWMPLSKVTPRFFNPFGENTFRYNRFKECQNFLAVNKPILEAPFVNQETMDIDESYLVNEEEASRMKSEFSQVVKNNQTLVKIVTWCTSADVYFFDINRKYFLELYSNVPEETQNPACK